MTTTTLESMPGQRRALLTAIKGSGGAGIADLARRIDITYEGTRQQLGQMEEDGWVVREAAPRSSSRGRPSSIYKLTAAGEHLFPKAYDDLAVALIDAAADRLGPAAVRELLEDVARKKVEAWRPVLQGKNLEERLEALTNVYQADDPFCHVEYDEDGGARLVEMNCPFLEVARRRPALCSVTVSVLRRLLGREVVRTERFQNDGHRCVFKVGGPASEREPLFDWEPAAQVADRSANGPSSAPRIKRQ